MAIPSQYYNGTQVPTEISEPTSKVELTISCRNLADMDVFSKSDPLCVVYTKPFGRDGWSEYRRTEVISNNLNPEWATKIALDYLFEERQFLRFEVYDVDSNSRNLASHDFIGSMECTLGEIISQRRLEKSLVDRSNSTKGRGFIIVAAEEMSSCRDFVTLSFEGSKLAKKDFFGKSDPFLVIYKTAMDGTLVLAHRTEVIKNDLNPKWKPFEISVNSLCGGQYDCPLTFRCFDWNRNGSEKLIGEFQTTLTQLKMGPSPTNAYPLVNPVERKSKKSYKHSGICTLSFFKLERHSTFMDYISAGTQLNCTIAIDFTASNGDPRQPGSLHHWNPNNPCLYARALSAVGSIIQDYDSDKLFPVLGFGAKLPPNGQVSHLFFVNGNPASPYCNGLAEVVAAYQRCLQGIQLYGPTYFAPIINHVAGIAAQSRNGSEYFILLMLTDGIIDDMFATKEAIVNAALLPLSIIIVGIGNADFQLMKELDGDEVRLSSRGRLADRDIVQFVPFNDFIKSGATVADLEISQLRLAKEVVAEIPDQFLSYMRRKNNIRPGGFNPS